MTGKLPDFNDLSKLGIKNITKTNWNLSPKELSDITVLKKMGKISSKGALSVNTGKFTGRSPKDRFIVKDETTKDDVWWGDINIPFNSSKLSYRVLSPTLLLIICFSFPSLDWLSSREPSVQMPAHFPRPNCIS